MRTFSAVRTRLRSGSHADQAASGDDGSNGAKRKNGSRRAAAAVDSAGPGAPLLADHPDGNGDEPHADFDEADTGVFAPADAVVDVPVEDVPLEDDTIIEAVPVVGIPL